MLAVLEALAMEAADAAAESLDPAPPFHDGFAI